MNILVVEDDIVIAEVIQQTLEKAGYHSVHVTTIEKALIEMNHNLIDAVLLDINLPDGGGTRLTRLIAVANCQRPFWLCLAIAVLTTGLQPWGQAQMAI
jgi:DNA-binding response OmpR family regulator